ncbi:MAG TPA: ATP synthase subunit I [Rhizobacter sp.]|nr:ATP synthase subunit I [Rhizobacter sp.]
MPHIVSHVAAPDEMDEQAFKTLTHDEAQELKSRMPMVSPWRVVAAQAIAGVLCAALFWGFTQHSAVAWSALYGVLAVVLPGALLARGMTKRARNPMAAATGFLFWEMLKIAVAVALLVIAAKVVPHLSWPALLITMVVCMKVSWLALWWRGR